MATVLRFIGLLNAAVWLGSIVFFTVSVGPGFFSEEMTALLTRPYAGAAAQIILARYFSITLVCGLIALLHLLAEYIYTGRPWGRKFIAMLVALVVVGWTSGSYILPKLKQLHLMMYAVQTTPAQKTAAKADFGKWHGISQMLNLLALSGVIVYYWTLTSSPSTGRFMNMQKFR